MPWNPLLIGYLKQCLWLRLSMMTHGGFDFFPLSPLNEFNELIIGLFLGANLFCCE